jgi:hypothetical protein
VKHVPNNIHRGYKSVAEANAAFEYARARSWTRVADAAVVGPPIPALPMPLGINDNHQNPLNGSETLDDFWFVVYKGICPGVYRSQ